MRYSFGSPSGDTILGTAQADHLYGGGGIDTITGGFGNDYLEGGAGHDLLLGGAGNDKLLGQAGRDILIGGLGSDLLNGGIDDDILIGGTTNHDANVVALAAIQAEWNSNAVISIRIAHLHGSVGGGLNGAFLLTPGGTVHADGAVDKLFSDIGFDWLFVSIADHDQILDQNLAKDRVVSF